MLISHQLSHAPLYTLQLASFASFFQTKCIRVLDYAYSTTCAVFGKRPVVVGLWRGIAQLALLEYNGGHRAIQ